MEPAGFGQLDAAGGAVEQRGAQALFQPGDLMTDGALGDVQSLGRRLGSCRAGPPPRRRGYWRLLAARLHGRAGGFVVR